MVSNSILSAATYVPKGGVGKTTTTAHVAVAAAQDNDLDVLVIDLAGTQNDMATQFGIRDDVRDPDAPISAIFGDQWEFIQNNVDDVVGRMTYATDENVDLIPADSGIGAADNNLANVNKEDRYDKLQTFVDEHVAPEYDLVLFDLPGKEDNIALNGLFAAENVVAPLRPGEFERDQLQTLKENLATIRDAHEANYDSAPELRMVIPTMINRNTNLAQQFVEDINDQHPELATEPVAETANIGNEQANGQTLFALEDDELYSTGKRARDAYRQITDDLLGRLEVPAHV